MNKIRVTLRVDFERNSAIGPGKIALLERMRDCGSLSQAARELDMSYRRAWQLLDNLNRSFREPLVITATGGSGGGGSTLTPLGETVVSTYRKFERDMNTRAAKHFDAIAAAATSAEGGTRRSVARSQAPAASGRVSRRARQTKAN